MSKHPELPERVYPKGRWYYLVRAEGKKRIWQKLTPISKGLAELYTKLAELHTSEIAPDRIPALVAEWKLEVMPAHAKKTQANDHWAMNTISESLAEFRAGQVRPPDVAAFLQPWRVRPSSWDDEKQGPWRAQPRTHNEMRAALRELMRFAEEKGYREAGSNPVDSIRTMSTPPRRKYITDSELRRIKHGALVGDDGLRTRSGPMLCAAIDLAYLTGQRVGDLLQLRWSKRLATDKTGAVVAPYIAEEGMYFEPSKTAGSTGAKVLITWTPKLRALVERIKAIGRRNVAWVITTQDAQPYTYSGFATAWKRAVKRAGVVDCHFHDIRAKAITDTEESQGMRAARRKGAHSTEGQTADYVRHRKAQKTEATR